MLEAYILTLTGVALGQLSPGPNLLAVAGSALGQGRRAAVMTALGIATAIFVWVTTAAFGLAVLIALYPPLLIAMKLAGGGYLCFIALKALRAAWSGSTVSFRESHTATTPTAAAWRRGFLINITNPKSALLWSAVATFLFGSGLTTTQVLGFAPIGFASAFVIYGIYALLFSMEIAKRGYARFARGVEGLFGVAFGALGGALIADGLRDAAR
ncbi:MAG TPA: LysE family translocator [Paracoccaceae bacterium]|nr:LysE family translocator [Paracoccaceae bacterium]